MGLMVKCSGGCVCQEKRGVGRLKSVMRIRAISKAMSPFISKG